MKLHPGSFEGRCAIVRARQQHLRDVEKAKRAERRVGKTPAARSRYNTAYRAKARAKLSEPLYSPDPISPFELELASIMKMVPDRPYYQPALLSRLGV